MAKLRRLKSAFVLALIYLLVGELVFLPALGLAGPHIPGFYGTTANLVPPASNTVPSAQKLVQGVSSIEAAANNGLIIHQDEKAAVIEWNSFDIGANAWTHFDQQGNTDWAALNRIYDQNPSQIFGRLSADGQVFLINQNGMLFSPGASVTARSLVATSLNITNDDFLNNSLRFALDNYMQTGEDIDITQSVVANHGEIRTDNGGSVFLIAPTVENGGTIESPLGQIGLIAGEGVTLATDDSIGSGRTALTVTVSDGPGTATNYEAGALVTEAGLSGMYGRLVNQEGLVKSVTAVKRAGAIELFASEKITTGEMSQTLNTISASEEAAHESFNFSQGTIRFSGLDPDNPADPQVGATTIEHKGQIAAPAGIVTLEAEEKVVLESGSSIDVGGIWVDLVNSALLVDVQLNSVELRDTYAQKDGPLQGETITVNKLEGSAIGHIASSLESDELTALLNAREGGEVNIRATGGDIVVKEAALVDLSGGGIIYEDGTVSTTKLVSGQTVYDISEAPDDIAYDAILGTQTVTYAAFGQEETFEGIYYGGANPMRELVSGHYEGADAGKASLVARALVLDGVVDGAVIVGEYQTSLEELTDAYDEAATSGRAIPRGGTLEIGNTSTGMQDTDNYVMEHVVIEARTTPSGSAEPDYPVDANGFLTTTLSAERLSAFDLDTITIVSNGLVQTAADAQIALSPGGTLKLRGRAIEHQGEIAIPAGEISLVAEDNYTSFETIVSEPNPNYIEMAEEIVLANGSRLSVAGEKVNNADLLAEEDETLVKVRPQGGTITLSDRCDFGVGVIVNDGATIDVSGGYEITADGILAGGDAGALSLQGNAIQLGGDLKGTALSGFDGGRLELTAAEIAVTGAGAPSIANFSYGDSLGQAQQGKLVLAEDLLADTGFTRLALSSRHGLTMAEGTTLTPSMVKADPPDAAGAYSGSSVDNYYRDRTDDSGAAAEAGYPDDLGESYLTLAAGARFIGVDSDLVRDDLDAVLAIGKGAKLAVPLTGSIEIEAPTVTISGTLSAPAGSVNVTATQHDLTLDGEAAILARGYAVAGYVVPETGAVIAGETYAGGDVGLTSDVGAIQVAEGARIDISGSGAVKDYLAGADHTLSAFSVAGAPGSLSLSFHEGLSLDGQVVAERAMAALPGAEARIARSHPTEALRLSPADLERFTAAGFDTLTYQSTKGIELAGGGDFQVAQGLTLDAPEIRATDEGAYTLAAAQVGLINSGEKYGDESPADFLVDQATAGAADLSLAARWLEIEGQVALSGFDTTRLTVEKDLLLRDAVYRGGASGSVWAGALVASGDLTIDARTIYPATSAGETGLYADFTIRTDGLFKTLASAETAPDAVLSAGGGLTVTAAGIEHHGTIKAPMGKIQLETVGDAGRVFLAEGSILSTKGEAMVSYGELADSYWSVTDKETGLAMEVTDTPVGQIEIEAAELILQEGATLDASAGGGIYAHQFLPGIEGSLNPFEVAGTYVILPDGGPDLPGTAIYLTGQGGLPAGFYKVLPETYAYLDGAVVLRTIEAATLTTATDLLQSREGYPVVYGYVTDNGVLLDRPLPSAYALMPMADLLAQGHFEKRSFTAGQGGDITIKAATAVMQGRLLGIPGGDEGGSGASLEGGRLSLAAGEIRIGSGGAALPANFGFTSELDAALMGKMNLDPDQISGSGFSQLLVGEQETTARIEMAAGSLLAAENISLSAAEEIVLLGGSRLEATADDGVAALNSPEGLLSIGSGAVVQAGQAIELDMRRLQLEGDLITEHSTLSLAGDNIYLVPDGYTQEREEVLYLTEDLWASFDQFEAVTLRGREGIGFVGEVSLSVDERLTLETPALYGLAVEGGGTARIETQTLALSNPFETSATATLPSEVGMAISAQEILLGPGEVLLDGFSTINMVARSGLTLMGRGALTTNGATRIATPLLLTRSLAQTIAAESGGEGVEAFQYETAIFTLDAGAGKLELTTLDAGADSPAADPGALFLTAAEIEVGTQIDVGGGALDLTATAGSLTLTGASLDAAGADRKAGGTIALTAATDIHVDAASRLDVSAGTAGSEVAEGEGTAAGTIELFAVTGELRLAGDLAGGSEKGAGGTLKVDAGEIAGLSDLLARADEGGFNRRIDLRLRTGDLEIDADEGIDAATIALKSDAGDVNIYGDLIAVDGDGGGEIALQAGGDLNLYAGSRVQATGGAAGGEVYLGADTGWIRMAEGATMDLAAADGTANGGANGHLYLRALRTADSVQIDLQGSLDGAAGVTAEALQIYAGVSALAQSETAGEVAGAAYLADMVTEAQTYMAGASLDTANLQGLAAEKLVLLPGIEVRSAGDLVVAADLDLTDHRFGDEGLAGVLTINAAGDLNIDHDIIDAPRSIEAITPGDAAPPATWSIDLKAGSDAAAASGDLNIADSVLVYTENGAMGIEARDDMVVGAATSQNRMISYSMGYNLATYYGDIEAAVGGDLVLAGGVIQSALGDISLTVGGSLDLQREVGYLGTIRTTGEAPAGGYLMDYWTYAEGGSIEIQALDGVGGGLSSHDAWDYDHYWGTDSEFGRHWSASFGDTGASQFATEGIAAMAGGDVTIRTAGDVRVQTGTFGAGDLTIAAGGDVDGRFLVREGQAEIRAGGNFGSRIEDPAVELFDARIDLLAGGNVHIGTITNPTLVRAGYARHLTYAQDAGVTITAEHGDVRFSGVDSVNTGGSSASTPYLVMPASLTVTAGRDIRFLSDFAMAPAQNGNLSLTAGRNIDGTYTRGAGTNLRIEQAALNMSDVGVAEAYAETLDDAAIRQFFNTSAHAATPVHTGDDQHVTITAGGNIEDIGFGLPKQAVITAGEDIGNLSYVGQNVAAGDTTVIQAGNDIFFSSDPEISGNIGIEHGGPGSIQVRAGNTIDLGTSKGIQSMGNSLNGELESSGALLAVIAGYAFEAGMGEIGDFFAAVRETGEDFSALRAEGEIEEADKRVAAAREVIFYPFLGEGNETGGDINMINSQISMSSEDAEVYILTSGELNVGRTTLENQGEAVENTGIYTESGGNISIYSDGDLNVNESRVMTFRGGDITMWSDQGNINAGRGSKLTVSTPEVEITVDEDTGVKTRTFKPPAVGSGIRTLTYDPDGEEGPRQAPPAGDLYLFAPAGIIDASEAGIAGRNVTLGAVEVVNAQNIDVSGVSVGVPDTSAAAGLGALTGSGTVSETSKVAEESGALKSAQERFSEYVTELSDNLVPKWLAVEVIGFGDEEEEEE